MDEDKLEEGEDKLAVVLERQVSYFSDYESFCGLLDYLGDSPWVQVLLAILEGFGDDKPLQPLSLWKILDPEFKDLVCKMTTLDPKRRITADEALAHPCFADVG